MARLAGSVHGVVVQITSAAGFPPSACARAGDAERTGNLTYTVWRGLVFVLDLGLGERGLAVHAPVHGLEALVDDARADEAPELAGDHRLIGGLHGHVRVLPVADDAEPLELLALDVDVLLRVLAAAANLLERVHGPPHVHIRGVEAELLVHLVLDGQAVAVPARHVDGVVSEHGARLDHEVLEDLVERRPHVDVAVGVGRPVVEDPQGAIG